jgi:hypothetical protein
MAIGFAIFVAICLLVILIATRQRRLEPEPPIDLYSNEYRNSIRQKHMDAIEDLGELNQKGELSANDLNQKLGVILRAFASEYSGLDTRPLTLSELKRSDVPKELIAAIESFYPIAFRNLSEQGNPAVAVQAALDVIYRWI